MRCGIDLAGLTFLVIDDSTFMRGAIRAVLRELGSVRVAEAEDGEAALAALAWERPDIVVCDWLMQPMGGEGFMRRLRADARTEIATLPVIMVTSFSGPRHALAAARLGVNEFLEKPLSAGALARRIERIVTEDRPFVRIDGYFGPLPRGAGIDGARLRAVAAAHRVREAGEPAAGQPESPRRAVA